MSARRTGHAVSRTAVKVALGSLAFGAAALPAGLGQVTAQAAVSPAGHSWQSVTPDGHSWQ